jgi:phosphatidylglycerol:prolipoprotein diacylglycerol transferase
MAAEMRSAARYQIIRRRVEIVSARGLRHRINIYGLRHVQPARNRAIVRAMSGAALHAIFDIAAWLAAGAAAWGLSRFSQLRFPSQSFELPYIAALVFGAGLGAYLFGTLNLWLSGLTGIARSVEGAIAGGTVAIELYKWRMGIRLRTWARFALPLAIGISIGRIGCYFAGLDDFTYGTPTTLPWGHDFGDGIVRHPVQLYESAAMAAFAIFYIVAAARQNSFVIVNGFYLALGYYGLQRFVWEFLKPYGAVFGPLTLFHLLSLIILLYAVFMLATAPLARVKHERAVA